MAQYWAGEHTKAKEKLPASELHRNNNKITLM